MTLSPPVPRTYRLKLSGTDCGTNIYTGSVTRKGTRSEVTITDNRARKCRDLVRAKVIVDETQDGVTFTRYSYDGGNASTVWPADAKTLVAEATGGYSPPSPAGSTCRVGAVKFSLDIASSTLNWEVCEVIDWETAFKPRSGTTKLSAAALALVNDAMNEVTPSTATTCGYDLPMRSITVTSASLGSKKYKDSFYVCKGDGDYVDNIDGVFAAFYSVITAPAVITDADNGKTFSFAQGQDVVVELPSNATTGFKWSVTSTDRSFGYPVETVGAGGTQRLVWNTATRFALGHHTVTLSYAQGTEKTVKLFTFSVDVSAQ
jgi:predicted secreted protein